MSNLESFQKFHISIKILPVIEGKFLLAKGFYAHKNKYFWEAVGGRIDVGETIEENMKREIVEELSINLNDFDYTSKLFDVVQRTDYIKPYDVLLLFYRLDFPSLKITDYKFELSEEHEDAMWVDIGTDLLSLDILDEKQRKVFQKLQSDLNAS